MKRCHRRVYEVIESVLANRRLDGSEWGSSYPLVLNTERKHGAVSLFS